MTGKACTLQEVFEQGFDAFARTRELHPRQWRAATSIRYCYTAAMGSHTEACESGDYAQQFFHACRHRSCPRCADAARAAWIDAQLQRLLPCPHFHVVFTWPHSLLQLWEFNRTRCTSLLFDCVRQTLLQLLADPRHLGAMPGLLMSLHTWGRTLSHHPHLHCLVSAGGLDPSGHWRASRSDWLLPVQPLKRLFRGKLLDALWRALKAQRLQLPPWTNTETWQVEIKRLYRRHWNVQIGSPYESGRGVVLYLARYAKGGPLPANRPLHLHQGCVRFQYRDHRDEGRTKSMTLALDEFISRVLWHAAPRGVHITRHAGLYSSSHRRQHELACLEIKPDTPWPRPSPSNAPGNTKPKSCPKCKRPLLRIARSHRALPPPAHHDGEISLSVAVRATGPPANQGLNTQVQPNWSFNRTSDDITPWPRSAQNYHALRGQGVMPSAAG